jgi:hypothetical protein
VTRSAPVNNPCMKNTLSRLTLLFIATLSARPLAADEVTKWSELANQLALNSGLSDLNPLFQTRILAMTHAAMHDAVNAIERRYEPYGAPIPLTPGGSPDAAAATAAYVVLLDQLERLVAFGFPPQQADVNAAYAASLAAIPPGLPKALGIGIGQTAASRILALRAADGAYLLPVIDPNYPQGTTPGQYRFTPPFTFAFETQWSRVPPFVLHDARSFRPNQPLSLKSKQYAEDLNEVKSVGGDGVITPTQRTPEQTQIALFWVEASPVGWNRIARNVSTAAGLDLWENARLFALLNLALADGYIASFEAKYLYNFWRPITAIREADADGNDATTGDPSWTPLVATPPIPDHDSGHSVEGAAAAEVLERFFGKSTLGFQTCSTSMPAGSRCGDAFPVYRSYAGFSQAALENGLSRIYVGFHFRRAVTEGMEHGRKIGDWAFQHFLRPANDSK